MTLSALKPRSLIFQLGPFFSYYRPRDKMCSCNLKSDQNLQAVPELK